MILCRHGWLCEEKTREKTTIENKKPDESMNKQNRENHMPTDDRAGVKLS